MVLVLAKLLTCLQLVFGYEYHQIDRKGKVIQMIEKAVKT